MRKYGHGRGEELATHGPALAVALAGVAIVSVRSPRGRRIALGALGTHLLAIATTGITSRRRSGARATTTMTQGLIVAPNYLLGAALGYLRGC